MGSSKTFNACFYNICCILLYKTQAILSDCALHIDIELFYCKIINLPYSFPPGNSLISPLAHALELFHSWKQWLMRRDFQLQIVSISAASYVVVVSRSYLVSFSLLFSFPIHRTTMWNL